MTIDKYGQFVRWYRFARSVYKLGPVDAIAYARDRQLLWSSDTPLWGVEPDLEGGLVVFLYEDVDGSDKPNVLDSLGGIDQDYDLSDHGNLLTDFTSPYLVSLAADMARERVR